MPTLTDVALGMVTRARGRCVPWPGRRDRYGYGQVKVAGSTSLAHRRLYELLVGPIPGGLQIDHLCKNKACVNPAHMEPVTNGQNGRRRYGDDTHCRLGHERAVHTYVDAKGTGHCRRCNSLAVARYKARKVTQ